MNKWTNLNRVERALSVGRDETLLTCHLAEKAALTTISCRFLTSDTQGSSGRRSLKAKELVEELLAVFQPFCKFGLWGVNVGNMATK